MHTLPARRIAGDRTRRTRRPARSQRRRQVHDPAPPGRPAPGAPALPARARTGAHAHRHGVVGRIAIDDIDLGPKTIARIRDLVGIVFQDPDDQPIGLTVGEDVGYGPRARRWPAGDIERATKDAMADVGLSGYEHRSPHHLSAGEKRRVCLAGVLVCGPGLLLLDEPSSGLDPRGRRGLAGLLTGLPATQVIATHDLTLVERVCPRAIIVDDGVIVADGPTAVVLGDAALLERHGLA